MKNFYTVITTLIFLCTSVTFAAEWKDPDAQSPGTRQNPDQKQTRQSDRTTRQSNKESPAKLTGEVGLEVRWFCEMQHAYDDKGSGGEQNVKFFLPILPPGYSMLGGYAQGNYHRSNGCVLGVRPLNQASNVLLTSPVNWERIWTDKNSGANMDGSIWHPQPGSAEYVCLGSVARQGYQKPDLPNYACVHQCLVEEVPVTDFIWSDRGTGASSDVSVYKLHNSNGFLAVPSHSSPQRLMDISRNPVCRSGN